MRIDPFVQLADALRERLTVIADRELFARDPVAHLDKLRTVSEKITSFAAILPRPLPGDFEHFLERASYEKALAWLDARNPERKAS